jgi:hypothetical protein
MFVKLIGMIVLGLLSAALSYYDKNAYVAVFDDILGREEEDSLAVKVGRGFIYGFFFPVYFFLLLIGLIALVLFLIVAGIVAAIVFGIVWVTEKVIPDDWIGNVIVTVFRKIGLSEPPPMEEQVAIPDEQSPPVAPPPSPHATDVPKVDDASSEPEKSKPEEEDSAEKPDEGPNVTRRHSLD